MGEEQEQDVQDSPSKNKVVLSYLTLGLEIKISTTPAQMYKVNLEDSAPHEVEFFEKALALLEGRDVFRRHGNTQNLTRKDFNPLKPEVTPQKCGFGDRNMRLNKSLKYIEFRKNGVMNGKVEVNDLHKVVVPMVTTNVIRIQKANTKQSHGQSLLCHKDALSGQFVVKDQRQHSKTYNQKCMNVAHYPFTVITKSDSFDVVAERYEDYRDIIKGIEFMIKHKKALKKISKRITLCYQDDYDDYKEDGASQAEEPHDTNQTTTQSVR